jgi:putative protein-disulfide isomerase
MNTAAQLLFLFDPLCGWCYAAHPALVTLAADTRLPLRLLPSGMFAGPGGRPMTAAFRDYAWQHDQHIQQMTGQPFTETYYRQVLSDFSRPLDSAVATLAFHVLAAVRPDAGVDILHDIQRLRYVEGRDITLPETLADIALRFDVSPADFMLAFDPGSAASVAVAQTVADAQALMQTLSLRGVPDLILRRPAGDVVVPTPMLYRDGAALAAWIRQQQ